MKGGRVPVWIVSILIALAIGIVSGNLVPASHKAQVPAVPPVVVSATSNPVRSDQGGKESNEGLVPAIAVIDSGLVSFSAADVGGRVYEPVGDSSASVLAPAASVSRPELTGEVLQDAPTVPVAAKAAPTVGGEGSREKAPLVRLNSVKALAVDRALATPLLALRRGGGRVVFFETQGDRDKDLPVGLEGEWAVAGRCGERLWMDLSQPTSGVGRVRGIGRLGRGAGSWDAALVVPRHACGAVGSRWLTPRAASATDQRRYGTFAGSFGAADLSSVLDGSAGTVLVYRSGSSRARLVLVHNGEVLWADEVGDSFSSSDNGFAADGIRLLGIYRIDGREEVFVLTTRQGEPFAFFRLRRLDGGRWEADYPSPVG